VAKQLQWLADCRVEGEVRRLGQGGREELVTVAEEPQHRVVHKAGAKGEEQRKWQSD